MEERIPSLIALGRMLTAAEIAYAHFAVRTSALAICVLHGGRDLNTDKAE